MARRIYHPNGISPAINAHASDTIPKILIEDMDRLRIKNATAQGYTDVFPGSVFDGAFPNSETRRGRCQEGGRIAPTLMTSATVCKYEGNRRCRKLTERECFRLMGVTDEDFEKMRDAGIPSTQLYSLAGNSIVVDVIADIFTNMFVSCDKPEDYLF